MSNVIEFKQKHFKSGTVRCEHCAHEWVAVWPVNSEPLECPKCGLLKGREFYGPSLYDYIKLPNGATVTDALDAYLQGVKEGKKQAKTEQDEPVDISDTLKPTVAVILPNGVRVTNVYEAYEAGLKEWRSQDEEPNAVRCKRCGNPTMHMGDICYSCAHKMDDLPNALKSNHPAPRPEFVRLSEEEVNSLTYAPLEPYELICAVENMLERKNRG